MSVNVSPVRARRWTRVEYEKLVEQSFFPSDERLELLDGVLVVKEPQGARHAAVVVAVRQTLERAFGRRHHVRDQAPVALDDSSEPEPDLAVVPGKPFDYLAGHPASPVLLVEIAESSLGTDRRRKSSLYARAGRPEYWVVNLIDRAVEVYREPVRSATALYGWKYRSVRLLKPGATVAPLGAPRARVRVADLVP
jgi:Uma2 family endonuclease